MFAEIKRFIRDQMRLQLIITKCEGKSSKVDSVFSLVVKVYLFDCIQDSQ